MSPEEGPLGKTKKIRGAGWISSIRNTRYHLSSATSGGRLLRPLDFPAVALKIERVKKSNFCFLFTLSLLLGAATPSAQGGFTPLPAPQCQITRFDENTVSLACKQATGARSHAKRMRRDLFEAMFGSVEKLGSVNLPPIKEPGDQ